MSPVPHRTTSRILDILETVALHPQGISLSDIAQSLEVPKSSIHPLLATLADRNYLKSNKKEQRFFLGENLFVLGNKFVNDADILDKIKEVLLYVAEKTSETLYFGVLSNLDVLYLIKADQFSNFRVVSNPGNKLPAYSTGYGKALLSQFSAAQIRSLYPSGTLPQITGNTLSTVDALNEQLEAIRNSGFSYEKGESTTGIQCVAVPIIVEGKVLSGMSIAVPVFRYDAAREQEFKAYLLEAKQEIERIITDNRSQWNYS
ncbi:MAG: IclR family transcriptional regulator [Sphaerochaeta sp.]